MNTTTTLAADETTLVMTRVLDASPEAVFDAWVSHDAFQAWIGPEGIACVVPVYEARIGGRYRIEMKMTSGQVIPVAGVFRAIERPARLVFTWGWDGDPSRESVITLTFADLGGGRTELTLRQEGLGTVENRDNHARGWAGPLAKLERFVTTGRV
jgi:uncharacterized protein YndB with AHSA1/START domain